MRVTELDLSPAAFACLRAADITDMDQLAVHSCDELIQLGIGAAELYEVVCQLNMRGSSFPALHGGHVRVPDDRNREVFRLRVVEGLSLRDVAERIGVSPERVRQLLFLHFGLRGTPPTVKARKWAATERKRAEQVGKVGV